MPRLHPCPTRIHHNYLASDEDRETMISSVQLGMQLFAQPGLSKVQRAPFSVPATDTKADIMAFIGQQTGTNYHPACTCAIGLVVNSNLGVFGTERLRVADASVMPSIVRGNTNAVVIAIAEKAADILVGKEPALSPYGNKRWAAVDRWFADRARLALRDTDAGTGSGWP